MPAARLQVGKEIQYLRLHRHVERGDRFVADDERGFDGQRPCDADPLPLAARELMRVPGGISRIEADLLQELGHPLRNLSLRRQSVDLDPLGDRIPDSHPWIERAVRILEDDLQLSPGLPQLGSAERQEIAPLEGDGTAGGLQQAEDRATDRGLAAPRLPDEPKRLSRADSERDAIHRTDRRRLLRHEAGGLVVLDEVANLEERGAHRAPSSASQQRIWWWSPTGSAGGSSVAQRGSAAGQRG